MASLVDSNIGQKVAHYLLSLGFQDVRVQIETDRIYTVIGRIDPERRWNWEKQWDAACPQLARSLGSEEEARGFIASFPAFQDDPLTCSYTTLHFTSGRVSHQLRNVALAKKAWLASSMLYPILAYSVASSSGPGRSLG